MAIQRFLANTHIDRGARVLRQLAGPIVGAALVLLASGCGSSSNGPSADGETNAAATAVVAVESAGDPGTDGEAEPTRDAPVEPDRSGLRVVTYPMLGGLRVGVASDVLVSSEGDYFTMRRAGSDGFAVVARTSQAAGDAVQIVTVDDFLASAGAYTGGEVSLTDDRIEVLGTEPTLHQFRGGELPPGPGLFASRGFGFAANAWWTPGPIADVYLAEIEGGVLAVAAIAATEEGLADAKSLVTEVVPTLSLTTSSGVVSALPDLGDRYETIGEPLDFRPATIDPEGAPEYTTLFSPIEPGPYQIGNLSVPITVDFGPGWFAAPNFPTFVVVQELPPVAPGFRDIVFQQGANAVGGVDLGPSRNGAAIPVDDIAAFLDDPPSQLVVSNVDLNATLGGLAAVRFDMLVDPASTCQPGDPCQFMITSAQVDFVTMINPGVVHRTWWVDDVPAGPLVIVASAAEADAGWLDTRAEELLATLSFGANE